MIVEGSQITVIPSPELTEIHLDGLLGERVLSWRPDR